MTPNSVRIKSTLATGNTTVAGFANVTSTLQVASISTFSGNVVLGSSGLSANGGFGTATHVLHSNGTSAYWAGAVIPADDTTTDATYYPIFTIATSNNTFKTSSTKLYYNPSTGTLNATNFNSLSDETTKENIQKIQDATNLLDMINPVSFTWKDTGSLSYGVIAQEIEKVLPTIVATNEDNGLKSVSYNQLIPILVQAIKELKIEIEHLKNCK
jgi:hypothetical protein